MPTNGIGITARNSANISSQLERITFNSIRKAIPDKTIISACDKTPCAAYYNQVIFF